MKRNFQPLVPLALRESAVSADIWFQVYYLLPCKFQPHKLCLLVVLPSLPILTSYSLEHPWCCLRRMTTSFRAPTSSKMSTSHVVLPLQHEPTPASGCLAVVKRARCIQTWMWGHFLDFFFVDFFEGARSN